MRNYRTKRNGSKRNRSKRNDGKRIFAAALFMAVTLFCIFGIKANAAQRADNNRDEYGMMEKEYVENVRTFMERQGYFNSGITLTKTMEDNKICSYKLLLHHQDLDVGNEEKKGEMKKELENIEMGDGDLLVKIEIF